VISSLILIIFGSSAKITLTDGIVLGFSYGGKTATGTRPKGTRSSPAATVVPPIARGLKPLVDKLAIDIAGASNPETHYFT